ncbi:radical SAM protein [Anaerococcus sp. AGMB00486]|uniref:Radical SAM protein n=2 Tax=Anaerococcus TaxID=165779 RepID=A0ABX2N9A5_9FIRM|nr:MULTISPECIES: radical SAM protein [Anaerococcus]MSS77476.1 radical SAM protein [Anaerococcus porci]NVF11144.1 radical SAM protein [Anaerococcus faecalis]
MHYTGEVYRPPLEAYTPLLEVTYGCSHNNCAFCTMYHRTQFAISPMADVESDIIEISQSYPRPIERIYLLNGDPFVLSTEKLIEISDLIHKYIPEIKTITSYASFYNLKNKSKEDLKVLREKAYNELWFGVETGDREVLSWLNKGCDLEEYHKGLEKMKYAKMSYNAIVMQGIKGRGKSKENAKETAKFLNTYSPIGIFIMSTDVQYGSLLFKMREEGKFQETTNRENLEEQIELLKNLNVPGDVLYSSGHIVNLVRVSSHMRNKEKMIKKLEYALESLPTEVLDSKNQARAI